MSNDENATQLVVTHGINVFMFGMVPLPLLLEPVTLGCTACFPNFFFASDVLCNVSHFLCFPM